MRLLCLTLCLGGLWSGSSAAASSFVTLPAEAATISRSMVFLGAPARAVEAEPDEVRGLVIEGRPIPEIALAYPASIDLALTPAQDAAPEPYTILSPSIIALGEPASAEDGLGVENMNVAAIGRPAQRRPGFAPMVIRGGISGDAFISAASSPANETGTSEPEQTSVAPTRDNPDPAAAPEPMPTPAPPPPPAAPAVQQRLPE